MNTILFSYIEGSAERALDLERELTARPALAPDSGGEGELDKCLFLEAYLRKNGITNLERVDIPDARAKGGIRPNLIATIDGSEPQKERLWIISHLDVVPPGEPKLWQSDPWKLRVEDGKIYGRGVEDNQQGLVSSVIAALALVHNNITPQRTLKLLFLSDEECGNQFGIVSLLERDAKIVREGGTPLFRSGDMALIPDGGDSLGQTMEIAEKNILWLKITTLGKQTHGSRPDNGANAFLAASKAVCRLHDELAKAFPERDALFTPDYSTFEPTKKEANVPNVNTIPGEDVFYMDMRLLPRYTTDAALAVVDTILKEVERECRVTMKRETLQRHESRATAAGAPLVALLAASVQQVLGIEPRPVGIGGGTAGAYLRNAGFDAVVWSKLDDTAHNPNEYALLQNILDGAKVMVLLTLR